jgi:hypothetical protein
MSEEKRQVVIDIERMTVRDMRLVLRFGQTEGGNLSPTDMLGLFDLLGACGRWRRCGFNAGTNPGRDYARPSRGNVNPKKLTAGVFSHLWTESPPPWPYVESFMRRKVYHCTPEEFERIPAQVLLQDLEFIRIENKVEAMRNGRA